MDCALIRALEKIRFAAYPNRSRVHEIKSFSTKSAKVYVKREDELGFAANGSKLRKYLSLVPYLESMLPREVAIYGGAFSNHILALSVLLKEKRIPHTLFLEETFTEKRGNLFFTSLASTKNIVWVPKGKNSLEVIFERQQSLKKNFLIVPMGGSMRQSFPGALTLALDVVRNEEEEKVRFDHIFIDSGTGMMAAALLLGLQALSRGAQVHVVQIAGTEDDFCLELKRCQSYMEDLLQQAAPLPSYQISRPLKSPSFGSLSKDHKDFIKEMAEVEGIFLDPLYNVKLFMEARSKMHTLFGNVLIIHSGGSLSLSGFQGAF